MLSPVSAPNSNLRAFRKQNVKLKLSKIKQYKYTICEILKVWIAIFGNASKGELKYVKKIR